MFTGLREYESHSLAVTQVILKEREERKQNRLLEERDPTRMPGEVSEDPQACEDLSESSSAQQGQEPTSNHVFLYYTLAILCNYLKLTFRLNYYCWP